MAEDLQSAGVQAPEADPSALLKALSMGQAPQSPLMAPAAMLAGFGSGYRGQPNPVIAQMQAQQGLDTRRDLAILDLMQSVRRQRQSEQKMQNDLLSELAKSDVAEAKSYGLKELLNRAEKGGASPVPQSLKEGLLRGAIKPTEMEEVGKLLVRGTSMDIIARAYPWATPDVLQGMTGKGAEGMESLAASLKMKTPQQLKKEAIEADRASMKLLKEEQYPELQNPMAQFFVQKAHKDTYAGQTYYEGTPVSQKKAREDGYREWQAFEATKRPSHAGERIVTPSGGQYWNKRSRQYEAAVPAGELEGDRANFIMVPQRDIELQNYATRSMPTLVEIKRLIPRVLATQPVENIVKALELETAKFTSSSEDLRRLNALVFDANLEQVRALGGSSVVRQRLLDLLSKHAGLTTLDTQKTALGVIDISMVNMENLRRAPVRDPMIRADQRIGPGKYIVQDRVTGQKKGMTLEEGQISPPEVIVLGSY